eukprot:13582063-Alexandrium_andersonii.AAC.1
MAAAMRSVSTAYNMCAACKHQNATCEASEKDTAQRAQSMHTSSVRASRVEHPAWVHRNAQQTQSCNHAACATERCAAHTT